MRYTACKLVHKTVEMKFYYGLGRVRLPGSAVTIGAFDGVHLGHQTLISSLIDKAKALALPSVVILFEPQPKEYFAKGTVERIYRLRDKLVILDALGVDVLICLHFTKALATLSAENFMQNILDHLGVKHLVVGDDFRFGAKRTGDYAMLQKFGQQNGFSVNNTPTYMRDNQRVGSSWARKVIRDSDFGLAKSLLGRPYSLCGRVGVGAKLGRTIGIPTINIRMLNNMLLSGIFAVEVSNILGQNGSVRGAGYVGIKPTLKGKKCFLEVHLLDFDKPCYGQLVSVTFLAKIREDKTFNNVDELKAQMQQDIHEINAFFMKTAK